VHRIQKFVEVRPQPGAGRAYRAISRRFAKMEAATPLIHARSLLARPLHTNRRMAVSET
jgi:hypothetical protein